MHGFIEFVSPFFPVVPASLGRESGAAGRRPGMGGKGMVPTVPSYSACSPLKIELCRRLLELSMRAARYERSGASSYVDIQLYHQLWASICKQVRQLQPVCAQWPGW